MAAETWSVGIAIGVQTALGQKNTDIRDLTGSLDLDDGIVLGDRESGDANSGITMPNMVRIARENADVAASLTKRASTFLRLEPQNLAITMQLQGSGLTSGAPSVGEAIPQLADKGIEAMWQMAGLIGADGAGGAQWDYTTRVAGDGTIYGTIKLWNGSHSFVLWDAICTSTVVGLTAGGIALVTWNIAVGSFDSAADFTDGVTIPTFDYEEQASLSAPQVQDIDASWDVDKSPNALTVTIDQNVEDIPDMNLATGIRKQQTARTITADGALFLVAADSAFEFDNVSGTSAPTADLSFQVGTPAGATDVMNAYKFELNNLEAQDVKYNKQGDDIVAELSGARCTATAAGAEFKLQYN